MMKPKRRCYFIISLCLCSIAWSNNVYAQECPEVNVINIIVLYGIMTQPHYEAQRANLDIVGIEMSKMKASREELLKKPDLPEYLAAFLNEHGVTRISDKLVCEKITSALQTNSETASIFERYRPSYYDLGSFIIVVNSSKEIKLRHGGEVEHYVFDHNYNLHGTIVDVWNNKPTD